MEKEITTKSYLKLILKEKNKVKYETSTKIIYYLQHLSQGSKRDILEVIYIIKTIMNE